MLYIFLIFLLVAVLATIFFDQDFKTDPKDPADAPSLVQDLSEIHSSLQQHIQSMEDHADKAIEIVRQELSANTEVQS